MQNFFHLSGRRVRPLAHAKHHNFVECGIAELHFQRSAASNDSLYARLLHRLENSKVMEMVHLDHFAAPEGGSCDQRECGMIKLHAAAARQAEGYAASGGHCP